MQPLERGLFLISCERCRGVQAWKKCKILRINWMNSINLLPEGKEIVYEQPRREFHCVRHRELNEVIREELGLSELRKSQILLEQANFSSNRRSVLLVIQTEQREKLNARRENPMKLYLRALKSFLISSSAAALPKREERVFEEINDEWVVVQW